MYRRGHISRRGGGARCDTDCEAARPACEDCRIPNACAGGKSDSIEVKTKAHGPSAPTQPEFISQTNREVIFKQVENQEYSCDSGKTWQYSSAFTRLSSNKEYEFITRIKATQEVAAGEASQPIVVKTISSITYYNNIVKSLFSKIKFDFCKVFHVRLPKNVVEQ